MADYEGDGQPPVTSGWLGSGVGSLLGVTAPSYVDAVRPKPGIPTLANASAPPGSPASAAPAPVPTVAPAPVAVAVPTSNDPSCESSALRPIVLDPRAEALLRDGSPRSARGLSKLTEELANRARDCAMRDEPPIVIVAPDLRRAVAGIAARHVPGLAVMSYREVDPSVPFVTRAVITAQQAA